MITQTRKIKCKYCGGTKVSKYGKETGRQLYWCKVCRRRFLPDVLFRMKTPYRIVRLVLVCSKMGLSLPQTRQVVLKKYGFPLPKTSWRRWRRNSDILLKKFHFSDCVKCGFGRFHHNEDGDIVCSRCGMVHYPTLYVDMEAA